MNEYVRLVEFSTLNAHLHFSLKPELNNGNGVKTLIICLLVFYLLRATIATVTYIYLVETPRKPEGSRKQILHTQSNEDDLT